MVILQMNKTWYQLIIILTVYIRQVDNCNLRLDLSKILYQNVDVNNLVLARKELPNYSVECDRLLENIFPSFVGCLH